MLGLGVYSVSEAAQLTGLRPARIRAWFEGRRGGFEQKPFLKPDYERRGKDIAISFRDLVDAYVASQFRSAGFSLQTLRRVYDNLKKRANGKHGFSHRALLTDGDSVFWHEVRDGREREILVDLKNNQHTLPKVLLPFLTSLDFDPTSALATRWRIADNVVVDPEINFGKPIVVGTGVSTRVLAKCFDANGKDERAVALWYDVRLEDVRSAVMFETHLALRRAS